MENLNSSPSSSRCSSNVPSRSHTPSRLTTESMNALSIAKEAVPTTSNSSEASTDGSENVVLRSKETSFISNEERRKKGAIEIV